MSSNFIIFCFLFFMDSIFSMPSLHVCVHRTHVCLGKANKRSNTKKWNEFHKNIYEWKNHLNFGCEKIDVFLHMCLYCLRLNEWGDAYLPYLLFFYCDSICYRREQSKKNDFFSNPPISVMRNVMGICFTHT